jgi:hypothetical protein
MKDLRPALRAFLLADATISGLVGGSRVYPVKIPQGTKDKDACVVYDRVSGAGDYHMQGPSGYSRPRFQIATWAQSADAADALARAVKDRVDGYSGPMGTGAALVQVQGVFCTDLREIYDDEVKLYGVTRDFFVHYEEL